MDLIGALSEIKAASSRREKIDERHEKEGIC